MALDARDELLVRLWRDGKLSYEDALRYSTSTKAVRDAVRAAERDRADTQKATPTQRNSVGPEVQSVLNRTYAAARRSRHRFVTVEHIALEMLAEELVVQHLRSSTDVDALRSRLSQAISKLDAQSDEQEPDTEPTSEFQQVLQTAIMGSRGNGHKEVTLLDLLAAISKQRPDFLGKG